MVKRLKVTLLALLCLQFGLVAVHSMDIEVFVGRPPGLTKYVYPEYPRAAWKYAMSGKGLFLLKVNPRTGDVDEVKVLKSTGHAFLNELTAKAFFQWKFQPGVVTQVKVPVEFYAHGFARDLH